MNILLKNKIDASLTEHITISILQIKIINRTVINKFFFIKKYILL